MDAQVTKHTADTLLAAYPQITFVRRLLPLLAALLVLIWLGETLPALGLPATLDDAPGAARIAFAIDKTFTLFAGDCVTASWTVEGIESVYLDGYGVVGHDQRQLCFDGQQRTSLTVNLRDGTEKTYTLEARTFFSDTLRLMCALMVLYLLLVPRGIALLLGGLRLLGLDQWRRLRWVLLALAIFINGLDGLYAGSLFGIDQAFQIGATRSLLAGHGISLPGIASTTDLAHWQYAPVVSWPPGYSLLLGLFMPLTGELWWSSQIIVWLGIVGFFSAWFMILETPGLGISKLARAVIWLYWISVYPIYMAAASQVPIFNPIGFAPTDLLALTCFSFSVAFVLRALARNRGYVLAALAGGWIATSILLRYAYWPYVVILPAVLVFYALWHWQTRRHLVGAALVYGLVALVLMGSVTAYQRHISGAGTVMDSLEDARTPVKIVQVLDHIHPFPSTGFGFTAGYPYFHVRWAGAAVPLYAVIWAVSGITCVLLGALTLRAFYRAWGNRSAPAPEMFFYATGALTIGLTFVMLFYLTQQYFDTFKFSAAERYYLVTFPFFMIGLFALAFAPHRSLPTRWWRFGARLALVLVVFAGVIVGILRGDVWLRRLQQPMPALSIERLYTHPSYVTYFSPAFDNRLHQDLRVVFLRGGAFAGGAYYEIYTSLVYLTYGVPIVALTDPQATIATSEPISVIIALANYEDDAYEQRLEQLCADHDGVIVDEQLHIARLCEIRLDPVAP